MKGEKNKMIGIINNKDNLISFEEMLKNKRGIDNDLLKISNTISNY